MITAVDTNVFLDVFLADREHGEASREALRAGFDEGGLIASGVVWTEVSTFFPEPEVGHGALQELGVRFVPAEIETALEAARRWSLHRQEAGAGPRRVAADFLVGAHALVHADRLLTRDRGFYRRAFDGLTVVDPSRQRHE